MPNLPVYSNSSCECDEKLNKNLLAWQIAVGCLIILCLFYCGLRECICNENVCSSDVIESIEFCEKIANICMCCKEICCEDEEEDTQPEVEIPTRRIEYYEPNPMLVRERQQKGELPQ